MVKLNDKVVISGSIENGIYLVDDDESHEAVACNVELWHKRLGHCNLKYISMMEKCAVGIGKVQGKLGTPCDTCQTSKLTKMPLEHSKTTEGKPWIKAGEMLHADLQGPITPMGINGERYAAPYIDEASRYALSRTISKKSCQLETVEDIRVKIKTQMGVTLKTIRSDNGGEYKSKATAEWASIHGIELQFTTPYNPVENSVAERYNRSSMELVRCLIKQSGLPKQYWPQLYDTVVYLKNRIPHTTTHQTPYEGFIPWTQAKGRSPSGNWM